MRFRRWERWRVVKHADEAAPNEVRIGRHFTRRGAEFAAEHLSFSRSDYVVFGYWNSLWPEARITDVRHEVRRAA